MLESILRAAGENAVAVGNVGTPVVLAATDPTLDVLAVELSSFQLHFTHSMSAQAAAVLNVAPDHLDWHGVARRVRRRQGPHLRARAGGVRLQPGRPAHRGRSCARPTSSTARSRSASPLGTPLVGQVGLVEDVLVDRGFARLRHTHAAELGTLADLAQLAGPDGTVPPHVVANALAAAALALAHDVAAGGGPRRAARLRPRRAPARHRRGGRRRRVRRRLEGHQRARRGRVARRVRAGQRRLDRGRPGQGRAVRRARRRAPRPAARPSC